MGGNISGLINANPCKANTHHARHATHGLPTVAQPPCHQPGQPTSLVCVGVQLCVLATPCRRSWCWPDCSERSCKMQLVLQQRTHASKSAGMVCSSTMHAAATVAEAPCCGPCTHLTAGTPLLGVTTRQTKKARSTTQGKVRPSSASESTSPYTHTNQDVHGLCTSCCTPLSGASPSKPTGHQSAALTTNMYTETHYVRRAHSHMSLDKRPLQTSTCTCQLQTAVPMPASNQCMRCRGPIGCTLRELQVHYHA